MDKVASAVEMFELAVAECFGDPWPIAFEENRRDDPVLDYWKRVGASWFAFCTRMVEWGTSG